LARIGEVADYLQWGKEQFGPVRPKMKREDLWETLAAAVETNSFRGLEFGVAWGYSTAWWMRQLPSSDVRWDAFDRFTGLPRGWRDLPAGHFDANGSPPDLDDPRVEWHIGDIQDRLPEVDLTRSDDEQWLVLFDLDVYEPSRFAWELIESHLRPGDLLYFDEAYDRDERHLLEHFVLPSRRFRLVGSTPMALGLQILDNQ
jgi:hypothetical protein